MTINQTITTYADVAAVLQVLAKWMERDRKENRQAYCAGGSCLCPFCLSEGHIIDAWMLLQEATQ